MMRIDVNQSHSVFTVHLKDDSPIASDVDATLMLSVASQPMVV